MPRTNDGIVLLHVSGKDWTAFSVVLYIMDSVAWDIHGFFACLRDRISCGAAVYVRPIYTMSTASTEWDSVIGGGAGGKGRGDSCPPPPLADKSGI